MKNTSENVVVKYLSITFMFTYVTWFTLAILTNLNIIGSSQIIYNILHIVGGFGPTIGAIMVLPDRSLSYIKEFIFSHKENSVWVLLVFCIAQALFIGLSSSGTNSEIPWFVIIIIFLALTLIGGGNEELGWRGILQPELEKKFSFPIATIITGTFWMFWHIPLWFIKGMGQQNISFIPYFIYGIILSFWLASIYKKTKSVLYCMIFHGFSNTLMTYFSIEINWFFIVGLVGLLVFSIWLYYKEE